MCFEVSWCSDLSHLLSVLPAEVPVIPIIAKADCMTSEEREEFRERIINALKNPSLPSECRWLGEALQCMQSMCSGLHKPCPVSAAGLHTACMP